MNVAKQAKGKEDVRLLFPQPPRVFCISFCAKVSWNLEQSLHCMQTLQKRLSKFANLVIYRLSLAYFFLLSC